ncbi:MAG: hypothetical protein ACE5HP_11150 [Gemmatimonadota bacterium]
MNDVPRLARRYGDGWRHRARGRRSSVRRATAGLAVLFVLGAQPTYTCALACLLGSHHGTLGNGPHDTQVGHEHDALCHGASFTEGTVTSVPPLSASLVATTPVQAGVAGRESLVLPIEHPRAPTSAVATPEPPPPRV